MIINFTKLKICTITNIINVSITKYSKNKSEKPWVKNTFTQLVLKTKFVYHKEIKTIAKSTIIMLVFSLLVQILLLWMMAIQKSHIVSEMNALRSAAPPILLPFGKIQSTSLGIHHPHKNSRAEPLRELLSPWMSIYQLSLMK
jgi:hypothetical protein